MCAIPLMWLLLDRMVLSVSMRSRTEHLCEMGEKGVCGRDLSESSLSWFYWAITKIAGGFREHFPYSNLSSELVSNASVNSVKVKGEARGHFWHSISQLLTDICCLLRTYYKSQRGKL